MKRQGRPVVGCVTQDGELVQSRDQIVHHSGRRHVAGAQRAALPDIGAGRGIDDRDRRLHAIDAERRRAVMHDRAAVIRADRAIRGVHWRELSDEAGRDVGGIHRDEGIAVGPLMFMDQAQRMPNLMHDHARRRARNAADGLAASLSADRARAGTGSAAECDVDEIGIGGGSRDEADDAGRVPRVDRQQHLLASGGAERIRSCVDLKRHDALGPPVRRTSLEAQPHGALRSFPGGLAERKCGSR